MTSPSRAWDDGDDAMLGNDGLEYGDDIIGGGGGQQEYASDEIIEKETLHKPANRVTKNIYFNIWYVRLQFTSQSPSDLRIHLCP